MPKLKPGTIWPTEDEEAEIQRQIADDPDDSAHWENRTSSRPAAEVEPGLVEWSRRTRGRQKAPTKVFVGIRLDSDIVAHFRNGGKGWQTRLNEALRQVIDS